MRIINKFKATMSFILFVLVILIGVNTYYKTNIKAVSEKGNEYYAVVNIPKGSSIKNISDILSDQKLIRSSFAFQQYCRINKSGKHLKAGKYKLSSSMSVSEIVNRLSLGKGDFETVRFTIPEGFEIRQITDKLEEQGLINRDKFEAALKSYSSDHSFIKELPLKENKFEGYLYPDTYEIYKGEAEAKIIELMLKRFDVIYNDKFRQRAKELNMTMNEIITLASIIEREAKLDKERKIISGVFHNRLKKDMKLQSCATIQYILKERKEVLLFKDLEVESPYNTYKYAGLPPGPIASPGLKSIEAALYPDTVDYLYFVAKKDGSHVFSKTYSEHLSAQNKINN